MRRSASTTSRCPGDSLAQSPHAQAGCTATSRATRPTSAPTLIGMGPSAIGRLAQGHVQNMPATGQYEALAKAGKLATARGIAFSDADRARAWVIERLMCDFAFSLGMRAPFGGEGRRIAAEARCQAAAADADGLCEIEDGVFRVTGTGRPLVRTVAARFDAYLGAGQARHSVAV